MNGGLGLVRGRVILAATLGMIGLFSPGGPARAADLGGDCCADLEERVADLEATTVRKGNQNVSVQFYGLVNNAVLAWDDGDRQGTYVVNSQYQDDRFGFKGQAKISGEWSTGFRIEIEDRLALSSTLDQFDNDNQDDSIGPLNVRQSYMYIDNKTWGQVRWGLNSTAKYNITKDTNVSDLEDTLTSDNYMNNAFFLREKDTDAIGKNGAPGLASLTWISISRCYSSGSAAFDCSTRRNSVTYESPNIYGFTFDANYGEDYIWSVSLRYKKEWFNKTFQVGSGVAYEDFTDEATFTPDPGFRQDIKEFAGDFSIKHEPTGLYFFSAFSTSHDDASNRKDAGIFTHTDSPDMDAWDLQLGIQRSLTKLGDTSFFGGYSQVDDGVGGAGGATRALSGGTFPTIPFETEITGSKVGRTYVGIDQAIDSAALHLYAVYQHLTANVDLVAPDATGAVTGVPISLDSFDLFYAGGRIYF